jgi:uncharacterized protein with ParB-like and HNH nuclease domain
MNLDTSSLTYGQLMSNGSIYQVPPFQRDYSWNEDQWDDLWQDLQLVEESAEGHYMGYLVLQTNDSKLHQIVDGQQRLTTLSILNLAIIKRLEALAEAGKDAENNKRRAEQLRGNFIGFLDPVSLLTKSKLQLNIHNNSFYQNYLVPLKQPPVRNTTYSQKMLRKSFDWFYNRLETSEAAENEGTRLAKMASSTLADKLFFTVIKVKDELNAYKVFETLNARGVKLSSTDLLKNYLFSVVYQKNEDDLELNKLEDDWQEIAQSVANANFPKFLRSYWNGRYKFVRQNALFKSIRSEVDSREDVFALIQSLKEHAEVYAALNQPEGTFWAPEQKKELQKLKLFGVTQPFTLLLKAYFLVDEKAFTKLLKLITNLIFRYHVIANQPTNEQEKVFNKSALQLGSSTDIKAAIETLRPLYIEDKSFSQYFASVALQTKQPQQRRTVKYILGSIEDHVSNSHVDYESETITLEHVLPQDPSVFWSEIEDRDHEQMRHRLGNITLLEKKLNQKAGNDAFLAKRNLYRKSKFQITARIAEENAVWNFENLERHQEWLAAQAKTVWHIPQFV